MNISEIVKKVLEFTSSNIFLFVDIFIAVLAASIIIYFMQSGAMFIIGWIIWVAVSFLISYFIVSPIISVYLNLNIIASKWSICLLITINTFIIYSLLSKLLYVKIKKTGFLDSILGLTLGAVVTLFIFYIFYILLKYIENNNRIQIPQHIHTIYKEIKSEKPTEDSDQIKALRASFFFAIAKFFETPLMNEISNKITISIKNQFYNERKLISCIIDFQKDIIEFWATKLIKNNGVINDEK